MERQDHPAAHSYEWVQARRSAYEDACMEFGPDSAQAKKAKKRLGRAQYHYLRQTAVPPHLRSD